MVGHTVFDDFVGGLRIILQIYHLTGSCIEHRKCFVRIEFLWHSFSLVLSFHLASVFCFSTLAQIIDFISETFHSPSR